jgi:hypothetical protein
MAAGFRILFGGFILGFIARDLAFLIYLGVFLYYAISGIGLLLAGRQEETMAPSKKPPSGRSPAAAPTPSSPTISDRIKAEHAKGEYKCPRCGATNEPTGTKCAFCGSVLAAAQNIPRPAAWAEVEVGRVVQVEHPQRGKVTSNVVQRVYYGELWQERTTPDTPWTLTGSFFAGLLLENGIYLLNWQGRFYLLEEQIVLADRDIQRHFASPARRFASSNQAAQVRFDYLGTAWKIDDIGRFRVELADGAGQKLEAGAVGRFIHAGTQDGRALVVEDYQSGGRGTDLARAGFKVAEKDVHF